MYQDKLTGRFARTQVVAGKTYTCGCDVQPESATCRTHGNAIAGVKPTPPRKRITPNQRKLLEQLAASSTGEVTLPFRKAEVARVLYRRGLVASYTSRGGFYVIQTQEAADREARNRKLVDLTQDRPDAPKTFLDAYIERSKDTGIHGATARRELEAKTRRVPNRARLPTRLTRLESLLTGAAWHSYMAGRHAVYRDQALLKASETHDPAFRLVYVQSAREWHHHYLKSARACRSAMDADKALWGSLGQHGVTHGRE